MSEYNSEWVDYYVYLENLRQSGVANMFGATPYLSKAFGLERKEAGNVLSSWMNNYDALLNDGIINRGDE